ncbi:hypothetical protein F5Y14DRAFT_359188 [Nemania sp. NC0429]|nr:hypothetical protein F5Y14DRAFT_359188 [Nemania sp. NC0429]
MLFPRPDCRVYIFSGFSLEFLLLLLFVLTTSLPRQIIAEPTVYYPPTPQPSSLGSYHSLPIIIIPPLIFPKEECLPLPLFVITTLRVTDNVVLKYKKLNNISVSSLILLWRLRLQLALPTLQHSTIMSSHPRPHRPAMRTAGPQTTRRRNQVRRTRRRRESKSWIFLALVPNSVLDERRYMERQNISQQLFL